MAVFVRITVLLWADVLAGYAIWVMQTYLTNVWKLSFTHAAGILNIYGGISKILPLFFLFLVDQFVGNYWMLVVSSIAYSVGMGFLSMSTPVVLGACKEYELRCIGHTQKVLFYMALALLTVGTAGHVVSLQTFIKQHKGLNGGKDRVVLRILGTILLVIFIITGAIGLPYVKPWSLRFGIPAICTTAATLFFLIFSYKYDKSKPKGSPLTNVCRVFVVSASRISSEHPTDESKYHRNDKDEVQSFSGTRMLRCLEKAAIKVENEYPEEQVKKWRLSTVQEVEEAKIAIRMVPIWMTFIACGIVSSIGNTYFLEQANKMNRKVGEWKVPLPILLMLFDIAKILSVLLYKWISTFFPPQSEKYFPPVGIGIAMVCSILCCITAAKIETRRLRVIRRHDLFDKPGEDIPMSIFWLLFQFFLLAAQDSIFDKSVNDFYKHQAPASMENYLNYFTKGVSGLGFMASVLSVYVVGKISERGGRPNWFQYTLNKSRLDRYYWVLTALSSVNLLLYIVLAFIYNYKEPKPKTDNQADENIGEDAQEKPRYEFQG